MTKPLSVLPIVPPLTQSSYRAAVGETVIRLQNGHTDHDMADLWGVSSGTVINCRNRNNDLSAIPLLKLVKQFGPSAIDTVLALVGVKAVPVAAVHVDVAEIPCTVASALPTLIRLFADGDASDADIQQLDREGVVDRFAEISTMMTSRRDAMRLKVVR